MLIFKSLYQRLHTEREWRHFTNIFQPRLCSIWRSIIFYHFLFPSAPHKFYFFLSSFRRRFLFCKKDKWVVLKIIQLKTPWIRSKTILTFCRNAMQHTVVLRASTSQLHIFGTLWIMDILKKENIISLLQDCRAQGWLKVCFPPPVACIKIFCHSLPWRGVLYHMGL